MRVNPWNIALASIAASWGFVSIIVAGLDLGGAVVLAASALVVLYEQPEPVAPEAPAGVTMRP